VWLSGFSVTGKVEELKEVREMSGIFLLVREVEIKYSNFYWLTCHCQTLCDDKLAAVKCRHSLNAECEPVLKKVHTHTPLVPYFFDEVAQSCFVHLGDDLSRSEFMASDVCWWL